MQVRGDAATAIEVNDGPFDCAPGMTCLYRATCDTTVKPARIPGGYNGSGAQQGSFMPPTGQQKSLLAEAKAELAAVKKAGGV